MGKKPIYVLVFVHYEHHRLQDNHMASTNKDDLLKYISDFKDKYALIEYDEEPDGLWEAETEHWWIQKF